MRRLELFMPRLFPGVDPYLEGPDWADFHSMFLVSLRVALNALLPPNYRARINERVNFIELEPKETRRFSPDVSVDRAAHPPVAAATGSPTAAGVLALEPVTIPLLPLVELRESWVEIIGRDDRQLVAVIEALSPWNKRPGAGHAEYAAKRSKILQHPTHLVELDFLIGGQRVALSAALPPGDYFAMVSPAHRRPDCDVYAWRLPDPLPTIPIPLKHEDGAVLVDLAAVFDETYVRGGYARDIDYRSAPPVAIPEVHRQWVTQRVETTAG